MVVYFADDDNAYDLRVFDYIRQVKSIGFWAVGKYLLQLLCVAVSSKVSVAMQDKGWQWTRTTG